MAALTQKQRVELAPAFLKSRFESLVEVFPGAVPFQINRLFLDNASPDAVKPLRDLLAYARIYDYEDKTLGAENSRLSVPMEYLRLDASGVTSASTVTLNLYRSNNGGRADRRFSISWPDTSERFQEDDFVVFALSYTREMLLFNVSAGLASAGLESPRWNALVQAGKSLAPYPSYPPHADRSVVGVVQEPDQAPVVRSGQGYLRDVELKLKVERHAVETAKAFYVGLGATDIEELGKPYDLKLRLGGYEVHVEVKGSRNLLDSVFVTRNEVHEARAFLHTHLLVVDDIRYRALEASGWQLEGGRIRHWDNWKPSPESLTAIQYSHELSEPDSTLAH